MLWVAWVMEGIALMRKEKGGPWWGRFQERGWIMLVMKGV
jgi:hypothetical protein